MGGSSESPNNDLFNDLSQPIPSRQSTGGSSGEPAMLKEGDNALKPKRIACILCRKRKLRCDGTRPTCGTCKRLAHDCAYDEVRRKSGPKRGYVKALEARLQQVETLLKSQESPETREGQRPVPNSFGSASMSSSSMVDAPAIHLNNENMFQPGTLSPTEPFNLLNQNAGGDPNPDDEPFPWEMIGLGLDEPLPPQDVIDELHQIYFEKIHPTAPMIHRPRYMAAMNLAPHLRPPVCLRYIIWCHAASITDKYDALQEHFYIRARKYAQADELRGHGEQTITLAHSQAWTLICTYEFKHMYFPRAWLSAGRSIRLAQMMQLHRLDGTGLDVKQCLPPPKDWIEKEERRRTFWMAFCVDRYASIGTGWPMIIEEKDIMSNLPASEEAYERSKPTPTISLEQAMMPGGASTLSSFAGVILMASLFGRNLTHLHRPSPHDRDEDLNGEFWKRHRRMDAILLNTALCLPDHLRLPQAIADVNVVYLNMNIHTSAICLHQAAIFKADKHRLPVSVSNESKIRCVTAAAEIANLMRMISHLDLSTMNPFVSFCVYVAARVFVQYLKNRPKDSQMIASLQFLLHAMQALKRKNPLTESFLVQLDLDLEGAGIPGLIKPDINRNLPQFEVVSSNDQAHCGTLFEIGDNQAAAFNNSGSLPSQTLSTPNVPSGQPLYKSTAPIDMNSSPTPFQYSPSKEPTLDLPARQRPAKQVPNMPRYGSKQAATIFDTMPPESLEMDTSPDSGIDQATPASESHRGSTSATSYNSPQDDTNNNATSIDPRPVTNSAVKTGLGATATSGADSFFSGGGFSDFPNFYTDPIAGMRDNGSSSGFSMQADWDINTTHTGTGLSSMPDGTWSQMLDQMTWDNLGNSHSTHILGNNRG